jgi:hypothetical protein
MSRYEDLMTGIAQRVLSEGAPIPNVQGYIPKDGISEKDWTCTVRYPNPKGGMEAGQIAGGGSYLESQGISLPRAPGGTIEGVRQKVKEHDCAVLLGFQGNDIGKPHIIQLLDITHGVDGKQQQNTAERSNPTADQAKTAATPAMAAPIMGPPIPPNLASKYPPSPSAQAHVRSEAKQFKEWFKKAQGK